MKPPKSFVSIGAGNVATHICIALCKRGFILREVYSRTTESARILASGLNAGFTTVLDKITSDADFYLLCVPDNVLPNILSALKVKDKLVIHTAGSVGLEVFQDKFKKFGILYPLQTFSRSRTLDISKVPIFVEGCDTKTSNSIMEIAGILSDDVFLADSQKRKWLHISAVFASNFTNFMYTSAKEILTRENIDFGLLYPLMEETLLKAQSGNPAGGQTGPAFRGDEDTLQKHRKLLEYNPGLQKIYTFISKNIQEYYSGNRSK